MAFPRHIKQWSGIVAALTAAALVAVGCGDSSSSKSKTTMTEKEHAAMTETTSADGGLTSSQAADTQLKLDQLLAEHALLAQFATQKGLKGDPDFQAAAAALDENSVELSEVIGSVYGDDAAEKFLDGTNQWRAHIGFFVDYTTALAKKDKAGQTTAVTNLGKYVDDFGTFLGTATDLPVDAVKTDLGMHIGHLKAQIDAYAAGTYPKAYDLLITGTDHMFTTGEILAGGIGTQQKLDNGEATEAGVALRVTLDKLLAEHAALAAFATQKGYDGDKDFAAIAAKLDENSVAISKAIGSVYGAPAAKTFLDGDDMWRDHITAFVNYTVALKKGDEAGQAKAYDDLGRYVTTFAEFLSGATGIPQKDLESDLSGHVGELKQQIDRYADGDYEGAYESLRTAYAHMYMTGDLLAKAITEQSPDKFA